MKPVTRYQCEYCGRDFKTPSRHKCKMKPALKNCFTCAHLKGWDRENRGEYAIYGTVAYPDCPLNGIEYDWDLDMIKDVGYNMQCEGWEERE